MNGINCIKKEGLAVEDYGSCKQCWSTGYIGTFCNYCVDGSKFFRIEDLQQEQISSITLAANNNAVCQLTIPDDPSHIDPSQYVMVVGDSFHFQKIPNQGREKKKENHPYGPCKDCPFVGPVGDYCSTCSKKDCRFFDLQVEEFPTWKLNVVDLASSQLIQEIIVGSNAASSPGTLVQSAEDIWTTYATGFPSGGFKAALGFFRLDG